MNAESFHLPISEYSSSAVSTTNITYVMNYVSTSTKITENPNANLKQNLCFICSSKFKESFLKRTSTKKHCSYCNRDVCVSCSGIKLNSSFGNKKNRICLVCFNNSVVKYFTSVVYNSVFQSFSVEGVKQAEKLENEEDFKKNADLKERILQRTKKINEVRKEIKQMEQDLKIEEQFNEQIVGRDEESIRGDYVKIYEELALLSKKEKENLKEIKRVTQEAYLLENAVENIEKKKKIPGFLLEDNKKVVVLLKDQLELLTALKKTYTHDLLLMKTTKIISNNDHCLVF